MENSATNDRYFYAVAALVAVHALTSFVISPRASAQSIVAASVGCGIYVIAFLLRFRWGYSAAVVAAAAALVAVLWRIYHAELFQQIPFQKAREVTQGTLSVALLILLSSGRVRRYFYATSWM